MSNVIPQDIHAYVSDGIQTGHAQDRIGELPSFMRMIYEDSDWSFGGHNLSRKRCPITDPMDQANYLELDHEELNEWTLNTLDILKFHMGYSFGQLIAGEIHVEGIKTNNGDVVTLKEWEAAAAYLLRKLEDHPVLWESWTSLISGECQLTNEAMTYFNKHVQAIIDTQEHKQDAFSHLADVYETADGLTIVDQDGRSITLDTVSLNSQWSGVGYVPPRDSYRVKRQLRYEEERPESTAKYDRQDSLQMILREIEDSPSTLAVQTLRNRLTKDLYQQDKAWKARWSNDVLYEQISDEMKRLTQGESSVYVKDITLETKTVIKIEEIVNNRIKVTHYPVIARYKQGCMPSATDWRFTDTHMSLPSILGQQACANVEGLPDTDTEIFDNSFTFFPQIDIRPHDEESLRLATWKIKRRFDWERRRATTELNFTVAQWGIIYDTCRDKTTLLKEASKAAQQINETLTREQSIELMERMIGKITTLSAAELAYSCLKEAANGYVNIKGKCITINQGDLIMLNRKLQHQINY